MGAHKSKFSHLKTTTIRYGNAFKSIMFNIKAIQTRHALSRATWSVWVDFNQNIVPSSHKTSNFAARMAQLLRVESW